MSRSYIFQQPECPKTVQKTLIFIFLVNSVPVTGNTEGFRLCVVIQLMMASLAKRDLFSLLKLKVGCLADCLRIAGQ